MVLVFFFSLFFFAQPANAAQYSADIVLYERGYDPVVCGRAAVSGPLAMLEANLGDPGVYRALIRRDDKVMYVLSEKLKAYVAVPLQGDENDMRALAASLVKSVTLLGTPLLALNEQGREELPPAKVHGKTPRFPKAASRLPYSTSPATQTCCCGNTQTSRPSPYASRNLRTWPTTAPYATE